MIKNEELINKVFEAIADHEKEITRIDIQTKGDFTHIFLYANGSSTGFSSEYANNPDTVSEDFIDPSLEALYPDDDE